jgi:hypothetical protein
MRERVAARDPALARRATITTFHAYGLDLLRRHWQAADLPPRPVLLEPADAFALLERHITLLELSALRYLHDPAFPLPAILGVMPGPKRRWSIRNAFRGACRGVRRPPARRGGTGLCRVRCPAPRKRRAGLQRPRGPSRPASR